MEALSVISDFVDPPTRRSRHTSAALQSGTPILDPAHMVKLMQPFCAINVSGQVVHTLPWDSVQTEAIGLFPGRRSLQGSSWACHSHRPTLFVVTPCDADNLTLMLVSPCPGCQSVTLISLSCGQPDVGAGVTMSLLSLKRCGFSFLRRDTVLTGQQDSCDFSV